MDRSKAEILEQYRLSELLAGNLRIQVAEQEQTIQEAWRQAKEVGEGIGLYPAEKTSLDAMVCAIGDKYSEQCDELRNQVQTIREQCAKIAETWAITMSTTTGERYMAKGIAAAIRSGK